MVPIAQITTACLGENDVSETDVALQILRGLSEETADKCGLTNAQLLLVLDALASEMRQVNEEDLANRTARRYPPTCRICGEEGHRWQRCSE